MPVALSGLRSFPLGESLSGLSLSPLNVELTDYGYLFSFSLEGLSQEEKAGMEVTLGGDVIERENLGLARKVAFSVGREKGITSYQGYKELFVSVSSDLGQKASLSCRLLGISSLVESQVSGEETELVYCYSGKDVLLKETFSFLANESFLLPLNVNFSLNRLLYLDCSSQALSSLSLKAYLANREIKLTPQWDQEKKLYALLGGDFFLHSEEALVTGTIVLTYERLASLKASLKMVFPTVQVLDQGQGGFRYVFTQQAAY
jgi:hypothetical protein